MKLRKKTFLNVYSVCSLLAVALIFLPVSSDANAAIFSAGSNRANNARRRPITPLIQTPAAVNTVANITPSTAEVDPTDEEYNKYYQLLNELNECVRRSCLSNSRSSVPGACFNSNVLDQKIENNCKTQFNAIKVLHTTFELKALIDVKTKMLTASEKACEGLNGSYSGGNPPNPYDGKFMTFGTCSVKVGYAPEKLNKGESYSVRNVRMMDVGSSRVCNMSAFGVNATEMMSDGNEKAAINLDIQKEGALWSLLVDVGADTGKVIYANKFKQENGACICKKPTKGGKCGKIAIDAVAPEFDEGKPINKKQCEDPQGDYVGQGFVWVDNFDMQMQKAQVEQDKARLALMSGCASVNSGETQVPQPYISNGQEFNEVINALQAEYAIIGYTPDILYIIEGSNRPTAFGPGVKVEGKDVVDTSFKFTTAAGAGYKDKGLKLTTASSDLDTSKEKEACLCEIKGKSFSHYDPWDNGNLMCYYSANDGAMEFLQIRITNNKTSARASKIGTTPNPFGAGYSEVADNPSFANSWQIGAIEQAEGAYSEAMLTQYMSNAAIQSNMKGLSTQIKEAKSDTSMTSPSQMAIAKATGNSGSAGFAGVQNSMANITSLQKMQTDANKKYNAAAANYERAEANVAATNEKISGINEERAAVDNMADWGSMLTSTLQSETTMSTLVTMMSAGMAREDAIEQSKQVRSGFCYIVTKDNKIGPVVARENESFKIDYGIQLK